MNSKKQMFVFFAIMIFFMTFIISFAGTWMNFGFDDAFFLRWMRSWGFAYVLALPIVMMIAPVIRKVVARRVK